MTCAATRARLRRGLLAALPRAGAVEIELIRAWQLSAVERIYLPDSSSLVFKYAVAPFLGEHLVLADLTEQGIAVPRVRATITTTHDLGMIMDDLGDPIRSPTSPQRRSRCTLQRLLRGSNASTNPRWPCCLLGH